DYVPMQDVQAELFQWLEKDGQADHITLAGSGEPTLHSHFGDVFRWVKEHTGIASVLLTNGTLLHVSDVREQAALADKVKVTLSAWDEASFQRIHRPVPGVMFDLLVQGERAFREVYSGELSVEVFIVEGVNSAVSNVRKMVEVVNSINPDRIDINTAVRPPAESSVKAMPESELRAIAELFGEKASVTASFKMPAVQLLDVSEEVLLGLIKRHPASCGQLANDFNIPENKMLNALNRMIGSGLLRAENRAGETYYFHRD
ncbi:MAG: radical SAM protein, partial [Kiritimatiellaceae bacterium]|nr:radical SAM protein [Kiritimatiellaceae bacterium]